MVRPEAWQVAVGKELHEAIAQEFFGGVDPRLNKILSNEHRIRFVIGLAKNIAESTIEPDIKRTSELLIDLIEGRLTSTVSSPIDYW